MARVDLTKIDGVNALIAPVVLSEIDLNRSQSALGAFYRRMRAKFGFPVTLLVDLPELASCLRRHSHRQLTWPAAVPVC